MLRLDGVSTYYGRIRAIGDLSIEVGRREIVALIGANGAGKSTTLMTISGVLRPRSGTVQLDGGPLSGLPAHEIVRRGIVQVPEGRRILPGLSVEENLDLGGFITPPEERARIKEEMFATFPRLRERRRQLGGTLSGGEQQMLAIGRALMSRPQLLLLDEPSLGLAPKIVDQIFEIIATLNQRGMAILLVEQNAAMALAIAHRAYVLETGTLRRSGTAAELRDDPAVREAYLGHEA